MFSLLRIVLVLALLAIIAGAVLLVTADQQPPTKRIERIIPNDRFQQ